MYADAALARVLAAIERRGGAVSARDVELALAGYARARRAAGMRPESVVAEFRRVVRRAAALDARAHPLTQRLIELYLAAA